MGAGARQPGSARRDICIAARSHIHFIDLGRFQTSAAEAKKKERDTQKRGKRREKKTHVPAFIFILFRFFFFLFLWHCQGADFITQRLHALQGLAGSVPKCFAA